jgi:hypothetical protein
MDEMLRDSIVPYMWEKKAYILEDGTIIKFALWTPNRGQEHSVSQVVRFMEPDIIFHSPEFNEKYQPLDPKTLSIQGGENLVDTANNKVYQGIIAEVIELKGEFDADTQPEMIMLHFCNEAPPASAFAFLFAKVFELETTLNVLLDALKIVRKGANNSETNDSTEPNNN